MSPYPVKLYHRWGNFILWGILVDIGVIYTSYKKSQARTNIHSYIMTFLVVNSFLSGLAYCYLKPQNYQYDYYIKLNEYKQAHLVFGTALMLIMIILSLYGYYVKYQLGNQNINKNLIFYKKIHQVLGNLTYVFGKLESFVGMYMSYRTQEWFIYIYIVYVVMVLWRFFIEILMPKMKCFNKVSINANEKMVCYDLIQEELPDKLWFIFKDQVFYFDQNYIHPGGQFIWKFLKNVEIGQYFYGITQIPGTNILHYHSTYALQTFLPNLYGQIHNPVNFPKNDIKIWELKTTTQFTDNVYQFEFSHPEIEFNVDLTKIIPNHFVLKSITNTGVPTRLYTFIQCQQKPAVEYLDKLHEVYEGKKDVRFTDNFKTPRLSFFIKYYNTPNGFSKYLTKQHPETVQIEGPYQSIFKDYQTKGQIVIICGGTGILPFLDLLNYQLLMSYNQLIKHEKLIFIPQIERQITLFYSITSEKEFIGDKIILRLREIQQKLKQQNFTLILKCRKNLDCCETTQSRFTKDFLTRYINDENVQIYVCGPQILRNSLEKELSEMSENIIYL